MPRPPTLERKEVLKRLTRAFRTHGFHGTTLSSLAAEVGLQKASLYHLFPGGKVEMARAVIRSVLESFARRPSEDSHTSPATGLEAFVSELKAYFGRAETACLLGNLALSEPEAQLKQELRHAFGRWRGALVELQRANHRSEVEARLAAEQSIVQLEGALVLARGLDDPAILDRAFDSLPGLLGFDEQDASQLQPPRGSS